MAAESVTIRRARESDYDGVRTLLHRYFNEGDVHVALTEEDQQLRKTLQQPRLGFYVAQTGADLVACVQLRELRQLTDACECKRLYVLPAHRGHRLSHRLMDFAEVQATEAGFHWLYLDSKDNFATAIAMYRGRGYTPCERYNDNPQATVFFRKRLGPGSVD